MSEGGMPPTGSIARRGTVTLTPFLRRHWEWLALLVILLVAAFLRLYQLDVVPPGLTHDEADFSHDAIGIFGGARPLYVATYGYQDEPLMHYASALLMVVLGPNYIAVRATAALFGLLLIVLAFVWVRQVFGADVAAASAAWMAASYWPVSTSRLALQVPPMASLTTLAVLLFWRGTRLGRTGRSSTIVCWASFAASVAATIYAYEAARIVWVLFPLFLGYLALVRPAVFRSVWYKVTVALSAAALLSVPLLTHPAAWDRASRLSEPLEALMRGSVRPLLVCARDVLGMFTYRGDPFVTYNLPGRPILDVATGLLFYVGLLVCLWRWRNPAYAFLVVWLATGIAPSLVTGLDSATVRSVAAQPPTYILPAVALIEGVRWLAKRVGPVSPFLVPMGLVLIVAYNGTVTYRDYFVRWANASGTQEAYFSDVFEALRYLGATHADRPVVLSSPFPNLPHDPYIAYAMPAGRALDITWVDGRRAMVFPVALSARLVVLSRAPLNPLFASGLEDEPSAHVSVGSMQNAFDVYEEWQPQRVLAAMQLWQAKSPEGGTALPVDLGHSVELAGYRWDSYPIVAGSTLCLTTLWRVLDPAALGPVAPGLYGYDAAIFVHMLGTEGQVVAQEDRLDAPAWDWEVGESFIQVHCLAVPAFLPDGRYDVEIGMYTRPDLRRLVAYLGGEALGDSVRLAPIEVVAP